MPADYIPSPDDKFNDFQADFIGYVVDHKTELGVTNDEATALTAVLTTRS